MCKQLREGLPIKRQNQDSDVMNSFENHLMGTVWLLSSLWFDLGLSQIAAVMKRLQLHPVLSARLLFMSLSLQYLPFEYNPLNSIPHLFHAFSLFLLSRDPFSSILKKLVPQPVSRGALKANCVPFLHIHCDCTSSKQQEICRLNGFRFQICT